MSKIPCCGNCFHFREYDDIACVDAFQRRMSDGFCFDPNPIDDNMPRSKVGWCKNFNGKE